MAQGTAQTSCGASKRKSILLPTGGSKKNSVDAMIKELEKELSTVQTDVIDGFNKLERKV